MTHPDQNGKQDTGAVVLGSDEKRQKFIELIRQHDITYDYSDDNKRYQKGRVQFKQIRDLAKDIPDANEIWNQEITNRLSRDIREYYYWR